MPGFTPNFAIEYPCAGETIDATVFQTFADGVEAALTSAAALTAGALQRPRAAMRDSGTSAAAGAGTVLSFDSNDFATGVTAAAAGFTILADGIYMADLEAGSTTSTTTVTSWAAAIRRAGVTVWRRKNSPNPSLTSARTLNVSGPIICTAGQLIDFTWVWSGAGINVDVIARASISKICDL